MRIYDPVGSVKVRDSVKTDSSESRTGPVLPRGLRILAIGTGFFAGFVFLPEAIPLLLALMLIVGAAVQPRTHRAGKWLLIAGAFSVTLLSAISFIAQSSELRGSGSFVFDTMALPLFLFVLTVLVVWCDLWLIVHAIKSSRRSEVPRPEYFHPLNFLVWMTAAGASAVFVPEAARQTMFLLRHAVGTGLGDVLAVVLPGLALSVLDVALLIQGVKALHAYLFHRHRTAA